MSERTEQINVRLTELETARVEKTAAKAGKGRAEWIREALLHATDKCPLCGSTK